MDMTRVCKITAIFSTKPDIQIEFNDRVKHIHEISKGRKPQYLADLFKPEAGVPDYKVTIEDAGMLRNIFDCAAFHMDEGMTGSNYIILKGRAGEIDETCRKICDLLGLTCNLMTKYQDGVVFAESGWRLKPQDGSTPAGNINDVMYSRP